MNRRKHTLWFYAMICCVYGTFFSVESFYNFERQPQSREIAVHSVVKTLPGHQGTMHTFRLNKRYHPTYNPPCPICSPAAPERRLPMLRLGFPDSSPLPDIAIIHYALRGPPVFA